MVSGSIAHSPASLPTKHERPAAAITTARTRRCRNDARTIGRPAKSTPAGAGPVRSTIPERGSRPLPGFVGSAAKHRGAHDGVRNDGRRTSGERTQNQCFYLSLAAAVRTPGEPLQDIANDIRVRIENAVRTARPSWQEADFLGQEVGVFADFLIWGLQHAPKLRGRAMAVYDGRTGTCEVFRPPQLASRRDPILAVWYSGAHYRWVQWGSTPPTLHTLLSLHRAGPAGSPRVPTLVTNTTG